jgi:hypothetical protein
VFQNSFSRVGRVVKDLYRTLGRIFADDSLCFRRADGRWDQTQADVFAQVRFVIDDIFILDERLISDMAVALGGMGVMRFYSRLGDAPADGFPIFSGTCLAIRAQECPQQQQADNRERERQYKKNESTGILRDKYDDFPVLRLEVRNQLHDLRRKALHHEYAATYQHKHSQDEDDHAGHESV